MQKRWDHQISHIRILQSIRQGAFNGRSGDSGGRCWESRRDLEIRARLGGGVHDSRKWRARPAVPGHDAQNLIALFESPYRWPGYSRV